MSEVVACPACGKKNRVPADAGGSPRCGACRAPLPWLASAGDEDFDVIVSQAPLPALVDLWAPWCGPCRLVGPAVESAARVFAGRLKAVKVNVDEAPRVSARFGVQSIPTLLVVDGGKVVARQTGALPADALHNWVERALGAATGASNWRSTC